MSKKSISRVLALLLVMIMVLTGCGGGKDTSTGNDGKTDVATDDKDDNKGETSADAITDLVIPVLSQRELESFNYLKSQKGEDSENLTNIWDGLLEVDTRGQLVPSIAEEWGTEDEGLTWTFKIRDGVKWVDVNGEEKADNTAEDFATGLEWVLNFHKNGSNNTSMPIEMIKGAGEYYEYTKTLSKEEGEALTAGEGSKFLEMVGIEIPDANTVTYHCITKKPYFDSLGAYNCLYPISQGLIDELGSVEAVVEMNNENMWYNGAYTMTSYIQGNEKIFTKNPMYWDTESIRFDTVTKKMVDSMDIAYQLYEAGEVDYVSLTESQINTIKNDPNHKYANYMVPDVPAKYSYQMHFNFNKNKADGTPDTNWNTAIANTNFRKAIMHGVNLEEIYKRGNALDPYALENNFYSMKGLLYNSEGKDYTELVREEMGLPASDGTKMARLDEAKAAEYKEKAKEELTALGVTFPIEIDHYIQASNQTALDTANVLKKVVEAGLGEDFVKLNINTFVSSINKEVIQSHLHSIALNGWGADYADPQNYLGQETYGNDNAYYSANYSYINDITEETDANKDLLAAYKEFTKMVEEADAITDDLDARYAAYAKAEAFMLENALVVPYNYGKGVALSKIDNSSKMLAMFGGQNEKMKNWKTNANGYTTEEAAALEEARDAGNN